LFKRLVVTSTIILRRGNLSHLKYPMVCYTSVSGAAAELTNRDTILSSVFQLRN